MAFKKINNYELIRKTFLVLLLLPLVASLNIDCGGKAFHCVNSTHFMICVDLGGGVSSTIDNFIIECPPSTVCRKSNYFECEFPLLPTLVPTIETSANSVLGLSDFTTVWAQNAVSASPTELVSEVSLTETNTVSITSSKVENVTDNKVVTSVTEPTTVPDFVKTTLITISATDTSVFTFPKVNISATEITSTMEESVPKNAIETMLDAGITGILTLSNNITKINGTATQDLTKETYEVQVENVTGNIFAKLLNETIVESNVTVSGFISTNSSVTREINVEPTKEYFIEISKDNNVNTPITDISLVQTKEITDKTLDSQQTVTASYHSNGIKENTTNDQEYIATNNAPDILIEGNVLANTTNYTKTIANQSIDRTIYDATESNASSQAYSTKENVTLETMNGTSTTENIIINKTFERTIPTFFPITNTVEIYSTEKSIVTSRDELVFTDASTVASSLSDIDKTLTHSENILEITITGANYNIQTTTDVLNDTTQDSSPTYIETTTISQVTQPNDEFRSTVETLIEATPPHIADTYYEFQTTSSTKNSITEQGLPTTLNKIPTDMSQSTSQSDLNYEIETTSFKTVTEDGNIFVISTKTTSLNENVTKNTEIITDKVKRFDAAKSLINGTTSLSSSQSKNEVNYNQSKSDFESVTKFIKNLFVEETTKANSYILTTDSLAVLEPAKEIPTSINTAPTGKALVSNIKNTTAKVDITEVNYNQSKSETVTEESIPSIGEDTMASSYVPVNNSLNISKPAYDFHKSTSISLTEEALISKIDSTMAKGSIDITEANNMQDKSVTEESALSIVEETNTSIYIPVINSLSTLDPGNEIQRSTSISPTEEALISNIKGTMANGGIDITEANYIQSKSTFESVTKESTHSIVEETKTSIYIPVINSLSSLASANEIQTFTTNSPTEEALISNQDTMVKGGIDITEANYMQGKSAFESVTEESTFSIVAETNTSIYIPVINSLSTLDPANEFQISTSISPTDKALISNINGTMTKGGVQAATDSFIDTSSKTLEDKIFIKKEGQPVVTSFNESTTFTNEVNEYNDTKNIVTANYNIINKNTSFSNATTEKSFVPVNVIESSKDASLEPMVTPRYNLSDNNKSDSTSTKGIELYTTVDMTNGVMNKVSLTTFSNLPNDRQGFTIETLGKEISNITSHDSGIEPTPPLLSNIIIKIERLKNVLKQDTLSQNSNKNDETLTDNKPIPTFENEFVATKNLVILDQVQQLETATIIKHKNQTIPLAGTVEANNKSPIQSKDIKVITDRIETFSDISPTALLASRQKNITTSELKKPIATNSTISKGEPKQIFPQENIGTIIDSYLNAAQSAAAQNTTENKFNLHTITNLTNQNIPTRNSTHLSHTISLSQNISTFDEGTVTLNQTNWDKRSIDNIVGAITTTIFNNAEGSETATEGKASTTKTQLKKTLTTQSKTYPDREINQGMQNQSNQLTISQNGLKDDTAAVKQEADLTTSQHEATLITEFKYATNPVTTRDSNNKHTIATKTQHSQITISERGSEDVIKKITTKRTLPEINSEKSKQPRLTSSMSENSSSTQTSFIVTPKYIIDSTNKFSQSGIQNTLFTFCLNRSRGRYPDYEDCSKFYICIGRAEPIIGKCPDNTVFSNIRKQCTRNKAHCVRENLFKCISEGRFSDIMKQNVYYICVKRRNYFVKFEFQCQDGYNLNKTTVKCIKEETFSQVMSINKNIDEIGSSDSKNSNEITIKTEKHKKTKQEFECQSEGKFIDPYNFKKYYVCTRNKKSEFRMKRKSCDSDERFHESKHKCVDADSYDDG